MAGNGVAWNPLRCTGTALPPQILLMAKLIALCLLLTNHVRLLPEPFLSFIPILDDIPGPLFQSTVRTVFIVSALALLFNRSVRLSCTVLGLTILVAVVSSKVYYGNNKLFTGLMLLLSGLMKPGQDPWLLRYQFALVYFGAGLNKLLDPDWHSGQFFEHWATARLKNDLYIQASAMLPPLVLAKAMCWVTIVTELALVPMILVRRLNSLAIWLNVLFQTSLMFFTGMTFVMFFYSMTAASLILATWPRRQGVEVFFDGDCGICRKIKRLFERFDYDRLFVWIPYQTGGALQYGITMEAAQQRLQLVEDKRTYNGFGAFKIMLLRYPATYFVIALLLAGPPDSYANYRRAGALLIIAFFFPLFSRVGDAVYDLVARNRRKLTPGSTCNVD
ncbi:MAG: DCC1-like thiol-disulfide oxidoreductase family protein [Bryobacteraceae bacterium]